MKRILPILFFIAALLAGAPAAFAQGNDLVIPGPGGQEFIFRPVPLGLGENDRLSGAQFTMGDPALGFRAFPTTVSLGGAFLVPSASGKEWVYYLGKTEITEAQYYAVMEPENTPKEKLKSGKPMTGLSYYEAQAFLDRLNQWLFANALDKLPLLNNTPGYLRLPTEAEWEFAARGGPAVSADVFAAPQPYAEDDLAAYEWFAGPKSSHNEVRPVGQLKPNPLGLHDMLGNVSEMTNNLYQLEYYQGRSGGLTARGGHFLTAEKSMGAALRVEEPLYLGDKKQGLKPNRKPTLGLRLALSAPIMTDRAEIDNLEDAWEEYRESDGRTVSPAGLSTAPVGVKTDVKAEDVRGHLANIRARLAAGELPESLSAPLNQDLGLLEASLTGIDMIRKQAETDSARSWVRIGVFAGHQYMREEAKRPRLEEIIQANQSRTDRNAQEENMLKMLLARQEDLRGNLNDTLSAYHNALTQMASLDPAAVAEALKRYREELEARTPAPTEVLKVMGVLTGHFDIVVKDRVLNRENLMRDLNAVTSPE
ncbi:MAG: formylglycine-generating enzyme family protein [Candidatus Adiutrix sp.]|jgi:hypothetical protein|nr:formylglycine-generating enzyme family protein [Candidatus Adiutrix sp.]